MLVHAENLRHLEVMKDPLLPKDSQGDGVLKACPHEAAEDS